MVGAYRNRAGALRNVSTNRLWKSATTKLVTGIWWLATLRLRNLKAGLMGEFIYVRL